MTVKLIVLYTHPDDPDAFDRHYLTVHSPLVDKIPGLLRWESARITAAPDGGELPFFRIAELYFEDQAAFEAGQASEASKLAGADFAQIAPAGSRRLIAVVD